MPKSFLITRGEMILVYEPMISRGVLMKVDGTQPILLSIRILRESDGEKNAIKNKHKICTHIITILL